MEKKNIFKYFLMSRVRHNSRTEINDFLWAELGDCPVKWLRFPPLRLLPAELESVACARARNDVGLQGDPQIL